VLRTTWDSGPHWHPCLNELPRRFEGSDHESMHQAMAATTKHCVQEIRKIQQQSRTSGVAERPPKSAAGSLVNDEFNRKRARASSTC